VTLAHARLGRSVEPPAHAPNAALLIDFDNVTLGIKSDLGKELRTLLNSDIIKGKVAVQRAYADWRRYPQYVVPLSESSIDLIFAPAMGSIKKNATDIRLAIDAMELVFLRPEIGTYILLSGDSDFSMLVIKLKEYGKYVIGVGIRESASDLLIQNCDEYYSYSDLAGLTREADRPSVQRDPWELVREAAEQMARQGDVMRSDRLKQVMQQLDPNFDERNAGFNRFSKFVTEAGNRGLIRVTKLDNGQYEVAPADGRVAAAPAREAARPAPRPEPEAAAEPREEGRRGRRRGGRGRGRERGERFEREEGAVEAETPGTRGELTLARGFELLKRALGELRPPAPHEEVRLRMAALHGRDDPILLQPRFDAFLRQAHDAEVIDLRQVAEGEFEVMPHRYEALKTRGALPPESRAPRPEPRENGTEPPEGAELALPLGAEIGTPAITGPKPGLRFRRGSKGSLKSAEIPLVGMIRVEPNEEPHRPAPRQEPAAAAAEAEAEAVAEKPAAKKAARRGTRGGAKKKAAAPATAAAEKPAAAAKPAAGRGGRGRKKAE